MKKKKALIISVIAVILAAAIAFGVYKLYLFYTPVEYEIASASQVMKENTKLVAHRGFRAVAPENTLPAYDEAGKAGFWGSECDVYRTEDGVWVLHHDYVTFRMMNKIRVVEKNSYEDLLKLKTNNGNNIKRYEDLKICTLEEYLEACKKYDMTAFIELKGKNNTEHYDEIAELAEKCGACHTYISFEKESLKKIRRVDRGAQLFYLVDEITEEEIQFAKSIENCGIDFNIDKKENFENDSEIIRKCVAEGLPLGAWTVDDTETMKKLVDLGVEYITTDCLTEN